MAPRVEMLLSKQAYLNADTRRFPEIESGKKLKNMRSKEHQNDEEEKNKN
jgi:hypothetical protein